MSLKTIATALPTDTCTPPYQNGRNKEEFFSILPTDLEDVVTLLMSDNESLKVLTQAVAANNNSLGKINLVYARNAEGTPKARFLIDANTIELHPSFQGRPKEEVSPYVLFELYNASHKRAMEAILERIPRDSMDVIVQQIESLEFDCAQKTHAVVQRWIQEDKCPPDTPFGYGQVHANFKDHYLLQQLEGHSAAIATRYSQRFASGTAEFVGTWPRPYSTEAKPILKLILELKSILQRDLSDARQAEAKATLDGLLRRIEALRQLHPDSEDVQDLFENANFAMKP